MVSWFVDTLVVVEAAFEVVTKSDLDHSFGYFLNFWGKNRIFDKKRIFGQKSNF